MPERDGCRCVHTVHDCAFVKAADAAARHRTGDRQVIGPKLSVCLARWGGVGAEDRAAVFQAMADYPPEQLLIGGPLWTRALVAELVRMVVGITLTEQGVGKWLRQHGC